MRKGEHIINNKLYLSYPSFLNILSYFFSFVRTTEEFHIYIVYSIINFGKKRICIEYSLFILQKSKFIRTIIISKYIMVNIKVECYGTSGEAEKRISYASATYDSYVFVVGGSEKLPFILAYNFISKTTKQVKCSGFVDYVRYHHKICIVCDLLLICGGVKKNGTPLGNKMLYGKIRDLDTHFYIELSEISLGKYYTSNLIDHALIPINETDVMIYGGHGILSSTTVNIYNLETRYMNYVKVHGEPPDISPEQVYVKVGHKFFVFNDTPLCYSLNLHTYKWKHHKMYGDVPLNICNYQLLALNNKYVVLLGNLKRARAEPEVFKGGSIRAVDVNSLFIYNIKTCYWTQHNIPQLERVNLDGSTICHLNPFTYICMWNKEGNVYELTINLPTMLHNDKTQIYNTIYTDKGLSDVKIFVGEWHYNCHRVVLATQSSYFRNIFVMNPGDVDLLTYNKDVGLNKELFEDVLKYLYGYEITSSNDEHLDKLTRIADKWLINSLYDLCTNIRKTY